MSIVRKSTREGAVYSKLEALAFPPLQYNLFVPDVKPFRLTESVKAAG